MHACIVYVSAIYGCASLFVSVLTQPILLHIELLVPCRLFIWTNNWYSNQRYRLSDPGIMQWIDIVRTYYSSSSTHVRMWRTNLHPLNIPQKPGKTSITEEELEALIDQHSQNWKYKSRYAHPIGYKDFGSAIPRREECIEAKTVKFWFHNRVP